MIISEQMIQYKRYLFFTIKKTIISKCISLKMRKSHSNVDDFIYRKPLIQGRSLNVLLRLPAFVDWYLLAWMSMLMTDWDSVTVKENKEPLINGRSKPSTKEKQIKKKRNIFWWLLDVYRLTLSFLPRDALPGLYHSRLQLQLGSGWGLYLSVMISSFAFSLSHLAHLHNI